MNSEHIPQYLYHYTNVDSLALILKYQTIRFNALNNMDDLQEQMTNDVQNYGKFVFVSSWTAEENEYIPMWRMYTRNKCGVRLKLASNPFIEYTPMSEEIATALKIKIDKNIEMAGFKFIVPPAEVYNPNYYIVNAQQGNQLVKVIYTDDEKCLNPTIYSENEHEKININLGNVGIYKNNYWSFQKEWRYRLMFYPFSTPQLIQDENRNNRNEQYRFLQSVKNGTASLPFTHYDIKIRDDAFKSMSVMLAPDISESERIYVELLVKEFNPSCSIIPSVLTNLIQ